MPDTTNLPPPRPTFSLRSVERGFTSSHAVCWRCSRCRLEHEPEGDVLFCPKPSLIAYPKIAEHMTGPATDVLVSEEEELLARFSYDHLPLALQERSAPFRQLAIEIRSSAPFCHDRVAALRKLLECKDATVRCHIPVKP